MVNWREQIEAQIASLGKPHWTLATIQYDETHDAALMMCAEARKTMQALLDVAVAAEQHVAEWDDADENLQAALDKLRDDAKDTFVFNNCTGTP